MTINNIYIYICLKESYFNYTEIAVSWTQFISLSISKIFLTGNTRYDKKILSQWDFFFIIFYYNNNVNNTILANYLHLCYK